MLNGVVVGGGRGGGDGLMRVTAEMGGGGCGVGIPLGRWWWVTGPRRAPGPARCGGRRRPPVAAQELHGGGEISDPPTAGEVEGRGCRRACAASESLRSNPGERWVGGRVKVAISGIDQSFHTEKRTM